MPTDGNGNGVVDVADYVQWAYWKQTVGAWNSPTGGFGALLTIVDFGNSPKVANVTITGSISTHPPYSFDQHDGSGEQLRTVPVGGADTVSVTFSEDVNILAGSLRLVGLYRGDVPTLAEFVYDIGTMTATWRFESWFRGDQYLISVDDSVTDIEGNRLDGEWVNPATLTTTNAAVSEFPSGNGQAGGDFNFVATLLSGDFNLDGVVNSTDAAILSANWTNEETEGILFTDGDGNGDGWVNSGDFPSYMTTAGINLQSLWILGDLNGDFKVDETDADLVADHMGMSNPTWADGDLNGDGSIDMDDLDLMFAIWARVVGCSLKRIRRKSPKRTLP